jgi:hypothetical protein
VSLPSNRVYPNASVENGGRDLKALRLIVAKGAQPETAKTVAAFQIKVFSREAESRTKL